MQSNEGNSNPRKPMGHAADATPVYLNERTGAIHFGCSPSPHLGEGSDARLEAEATA